jgi:hypothetical protein
VFGGGRWLDLVAGNDTTLRLFLRYCTYAGVTRACSVYILIYFLEAEFFL